MSGASSGIGRACAVELSERGFEVFAGVRRESDADSLRREIEGKAHVQLTPVYLDVADENSLQAAAREAAASLTGSKGFPCEVSLVCNAGVSFTGPLEFVELEDLRSQLEVNLVGQLATVQAFLPLMRGGRGRGDVGGQSRGEASGRIVFVGSMFGRFGVPFNGPYCASKFALEGMAESLRMELEPWGIPVSVVEAGATRTPIWEKYEADAGRLFDRLPGQARLLYERRAAAARQAARRAVDADRRAGLSPETVAGAVRRCLESSAPAARLPVGMDARLGMLASSLLPRRLFEWLILRRLGISRAGCSAAERGRPGEGAVRG